MDNRCEDEQRIAIPNSNESAREIFQQGKAYYDGNPNSNTKELFSLDSGVLRIFGNQKKTQGMGKRFGMIYDHPVRNVTTLIIEEGVEEIDKHAFASYVNLTSVDLPNTLKIIGGSSFAMCTSLKELHIPESVEVIDYYAFQNCIALQNVSLPKHMKTLHGSAFFEDSALRAVNLPEGLTVIENGTFQACTSLETVTIPEGVKTIEEFAFAGSGIKSLRLPKSLETVQDMAFANTPKLNALTIGSPHTKFSSICCVNSNIKLMGDGFNIPGEKRTGRLIAFWVVIALGAILSIGALFELAIIAVIAAAIYRKKKSLPWGLFSGDLWEYLWNAVFYRKLEDRIHIYSSKYDNVQ